MLSFLENQLVKRPMRTTNDDFANIGNLQDIHLRKTILQQRIAHQEREMKSDVQRIRNAFSPLTMIGNLFSFSRGGVNVFNIGFKLANMLFGRLRMRRKQR